MELKDKIIRQIKDFIAQSYQIAEGNFAPGDADSYYKSLLELVIFIKANYPVDSNISECLNNISTKKPKVYWFMYLWLFGLIWGALFIQKRKREAIQKDAQHNRAALVHLYRAIALEEILAGKLPML